MAEEQAVPDNHEDKVNDMTERLEDRVKSTELLMLHTNDMGDHWAVAEAITEAEHLSQRLSQVHSCLTKVKRVVEMKETNMCLLEGEEEKNEEY